MTLLSAIVILFLVMDPLGNVPVFLSVLKDVNPAKRNRIIARELVIALIVLALFVVSGPLIMGVLQISGPSLSIAGGVVLFLIALKMIFPVHEGVFGESPEGEPFIVPLAIPLVAGPSAITTVLLLVTREPARRMDWLLALTCAWVVTAVLLLLSGYLSRFLGQLGLLALQRLMGMILTTVAVQMFMTGLAQFQTH
jgi:multiple antibiotic resistance protein